MLGSQLRSLSIGFSSGCLTARPVCANCHCKLLIYEYSSSSGWRIGRWGSFVERRGSLRGGGGGGGGERERQTDRQTGRQAGRQTDRQTDRQTGRQAQRDREKKGGGWLLSKEKLLKASIDFVCF